MKNTIPIATIILLTASMFFYTKLSDRHIRRVCMQKVYVARAGQKEARKLSLTEQLDALDNPPLDKGKKGRRENNKYSGVPDRGDQIIFGLDTHETNNIYRRCLAEYGMKPEDLVK